MSRLPAGGFGVGSDAAEVEVGGHVEGGAVVAPGAVGGAVTGEDAAEEFAVGRNDEDAAGSGGPDVSLLVEFEPVGGAWAFEVFAVEEGGSFVEGAVGLDVVLFDDGGGAVGLGDVGGFFIVGEGDPVGAVEGGIDDRDFAIGSDAVDAEDVDFAGRVILALGKSVGWVGEVDAAVGVDGEVVGAVEALAVEVVGEGAFAAAFGEDGDAAVAVFAAEKSALLVEVEAVGTAFASVVTEASEAGGGHVDGEAVLFVPLEDFVFGDVGEEEAIVLLVPDGSFGPVEAGGEDFDLGVGGDEFVEGGVEAFDGAEGGAGGLGGEGEGEGEGEKEEEAHDLMTLGDSWGWGEGKWGACGPVVGAKLKVSGLGRGGLLNVELRLR